MSKYHSDLKDKLFLHRIIKKAGNETLKHFGNAKIIKTKRNEADIVTQADIASHNLIVKEIKKAYPNDGIISEEDSEYKINSEYVWIIDPVDGTRNFSKGDEYAVMIALAHKSEITMGAIYLPVTKELALAIKGKGTLINGRKASCSNFPSFKYSYGIDDSWGEHLPFTNIQYEKNNIWHSRNNCVGVSALKVAKGQRDWFIFSGSKGLWDYAPTVIILKEAGCTVTNLKKKAWSIKDRQMLAANKKLHENISKHI